MHVNALMRFIISNFYLIIVYQCLLDMIIILSFLLKIELYFFTVLLCDQLYCTINQFHIFIPNK